MYDRRFVTTSNRCAHNPRMGRGNRSKFDGTDGRHNSNVATHYRPPAIRLSICVCGTPGDREQQLQGSRIVLSNSLQAKSRWADSSHN